ncbi:hypothetical protein VM98_12520 [Streptomyces rubellomurinus subsp. indigoferus]|nr:hypothetical protein VM98_12520 [Streptomyces rubellomurinus subsp. indigoferus]
MMQPPSACGFRREGGMRRLRVPEIVPAVVERPASVEVYALCSSELSYRPHSRTAARDLNPEPQDPK